MFCKNCGASLPDNASYCSSCGSKTEEIKESPATEETGPEDVKIIYVDSNTKIEKRAKPAMLTMLLGAVVGDIVAISELVDNCALCNSTYYYTGAAKGFFGEGVFISIIASVITIALTFFALSHITCNAYVLKCPYCDSVIYVPVDSDGYTCNACHKRIVIKKTYENNWSLADRFSDMTPVSDNEWKCSKCGRVNQNYVGTCACGEVKPHK